MIDIVEVFAANNIEESFLKSYMRVESMNAS